MDAALASFLAALRAFFTIDAETGHQVGITSEHYEIHEGDHFYNSGFETKDSAETIEFVLTTPDTTKWTHLTFLVNSIKGISFEIFENASDVVDGASVTPFNNNRNSAKVTGMTMVKDPTSITDGSRIDGHSVGALKTAGVASRDDELVLKRNTTYLMRITSLDNANVISYHGSWYEHTA